TTLPAALAAAAIAAKAATSRSSPRAVGGMPARVRISTAFSAPPAHGARAERSILRRWPKAASTAAKTIRRSTAAGGGRRVNATNPDSTLGTGQKTLAGIRPAWRAAAYQASFTLGAP